MVFDGSTTAPCDDGSDDIIGASSGKGNHLKLESERCHDVEASDSPGKVHDTSALDVVSM